jgi:hypothetical protein
MKTSINLFDHSNKLFVMIKKSADTNHWERFVSKNKKKWELTHSSLSLDDVLKFKEEVIDNNFKNLYNLIISKE